MTQSIAAAWLRQHDVHAPRAESAGLQQDRLPRQRGMREGNAKAEAVM